MKTAILTVIALAGCMQLNAAINPVPSTKHVSSGTLETFTIYSPELQRDMTVDVLLPDGYDPARRYKVVYMHDGQNLFDAESNWNKQAWDMDVAASHMGADAPIIVGVYNTKNRLSDYMPTEAIDLVNPAVRQTWIIERMCPNGYWGDKYVDFLAQTLKPEIDGHYSTRPDMESTSVMGSSMGGLASMYALCRHPETFGAAACLSTHLIGSIAENEIFPAAIAAYLAGHFPLDGKHRIYFDNGDQTIDAAYVPYFRRLTKMLREMSCLTNLMYKEFLGQAHEERAWASRVDIPLRFILRLPQPGPVIP